MDTPRSGTDAPERGSRRRLQLWIAGAGLGVLGILVLQNQADVTTRLFFWSVEAPLFILLAAVALLGLLAGYLIGRSRRR